MENFLEHLQDGYANRRYDLDKKKIENFITNSITDFFENKKQLSYDPNTMILDVWLHSMTEEITKSMLTYAIKQFVKDISNENIQSCMNEYTKKIESQEPNENIKKYFFNNDPEKYKDILERMILFCFFKLEPSQIAWFDMLRKSNPDIKINKIPMHYAWRIIRQDDKKLIFNNQWDMHENHYQKRPCINDYAFIFGLMHGALYCNQYGVTFHFSTLDKKDTAHFCGHSHGSASFQKLLNQAKNNKICGLPSQNNLYSSKTKENFKPRNNFVCGSDDSDYIGLNENGCYFLLCPYCGQRLNKNVKQEDLYKTVLIINIDKKGNITNKEYVQ